MNATGLPGGSLRSLLQEVTASFESSPSAMPGRRLGPVWHRLTRTPRRPRAYSRVTLPACECAPGLRRNVGSSRPALLGTEDMCFPAVSRRGSEQCRTRPLI